MEQSERRVQDAVGRAVGRFAMLRALGKEGADISPAFAETP